MPESPCEAPLSSTERESSNTRSSTTPPSGATSTRPFEPSTPLSYEEQQYLRAFAISNIFSDEKSPGKNTIEITSREDALERAFHLEKTTLQYYKAMRETLDEPILDELVAEEKRHLNAVMSYMISGAKVRGLSKVNP